MNAEKQYKGSPSRIIQFKQGESRLGFVDSRPGVISQSIIVNAIQRNSINTIQREKVENEYGFFESKYYLPYPINKNSTAIGASFMLEWTPREEKIKNGKFGLVQTVDRKSLGIKKIDGQGNSEEHKRDVHDFFKRISIEGKEQHHIDSLAEDYGTGKFRTNHPVYGSMNEQRDLDIKPTDMETPSNTISEVSEKDATKARLMDEPRVMRYLTSKKEPWTENSSEDKMYEVFNRDRFEVRIVGLSGPYKNQYLGGIKWGWVNDEYGHKTEPTNIEALGDNHDNTDFIKASERWNAAKVNAPLKSKYLGTLRWAAPLFLAGLYRGGITLGGLTTGIALGVISGIIGYYRNKTVSTVPIPLENLKKMK